MLFTNIMPGQQTAPSLLRSFCYWFFTFALASVSFIFLFFKFIYSAAVLIFFRALQKPIYSYTYPADDHSEKAKILTEDLLQTVLGLCFSIGLLVASPVIIVLDHLLLWPVNFILSTSFSLGQFVVSRAFVPLMAADIPSFPKPDNGKHLVTFGDNAAVFFPSVPDLEPNKTSPIGAVTIYLGGNSEEITGISGSYSESVLSKMAVDNKTPVYALRYPKTSYPLGLANAAIGLINHIKSQKVHENVRIKIYGYSLGGAVALMVARHLHEKHQYDVECFIDRSFSSSDAVAAAIFEHFMSFPRFLAKAIARCVVSATGWQIDSLENCNVLRESRESITCWNVTGGDNVIPREAQLYPKEFPAFTDQKPNVSGPSFLFLTLKSEYKNYSSITHSLPLSSFTTG